MDYWLARPPGNHDETCRSIAATVFPEKLLRITHAGKTERVVVASLLDLVDDVLENAGNKGPPFMVPGKDLEKVLSSRKISVEVTSLVSTAIIHVNWKGKPGTSRIFIGKRIQERGEVVFRDYLVHEIGHNFLANIEGIPVQYFRDIDAPFGFLVNARNSPERLFEEWLASRIGRELLVPAPAIRESISVDRDDDVLDEACNLFGVTRETMVTRLTVDMIDHAGTVPYWTNVTTRVS